jgi:hypothetical protein
MYVNFQDNFAFVDHFKVNIDACESAYTDGLISDAEFDQVVYKFDDVANACDSSQYFRPLGQVGIFGGYDWGGTAVNEQGMCFMVTSDAPDTTPPYISGHRPLVDQINYPVDGFISIHIPETLRSETVVNAVTVTNLSANQAISFRHILSHTPLAHVPDDIRINALLDVVRKKGLEILPWTKNITQWRSRVQLLRDAESGTAQACGNEQSGARWPDLSDEYLLATLDQWLAPYLGSVHNIDDFQRLDLKSVLHALLPWPLPLDLERLAPERFAVPSGSSVVLDYTQTPPVLEVKLQEMFGCDETPSIADGKVQLMVHLLSPAKRPLQITQDLAGFWRSSYQEVKKEMKGRYPKHPWPDNPLEAQATRYTKRRKKDLA